MSVILFVIDGAVVLVVVFENDHSFLFRLKSTTESFFGLQLVRGILQLFECSFPMKKIQYDVQLDPTSEKSDFSVSMLV